MRRLNDRGHLLVTMTSVLRACEAARYARRAAGVQKHNYDRIHPFITRCLEPSLQKWVNEPVISIYFTEKLCFMPSLTCGSPVLGSGMKQRSV